MTHYPERAQARIRPLFPTLLLNLDEVAEELRCTRRTVERHVAAHRLIAIHLGRCVRVERRELESFIAELRSQAHGQTA